MTNSFTLPAIPFNLAPGRETAQWVLDVVTSRPELHVQDTFESPITDYDGNVCGTTRCIAGWAIAAHNPLLKHIYHRRVTFHGESSATAGARYLMLNQEGFDKTPQRPNVVEYVDTLYGNDAYTLFFQTDEKQSVKALEYLALGLSIDWDDVFGNDV